MNVSQFFQDDGKRPNVLLIITDQERKLMHFPPDFCSEHLPSMCRLQRHGLSFDNYFTNACMCSPSRATLMTSQFPVQTKVTMTGSPQPRSRLPTDLVNMATVFQQAGYHTEWHGKWHLGGTPSDYGFSGWVCPDAGNYLSVEYPGGGETLGGGDPNNDRRFLSEIYSFLESRHSKNSQPFLLVASFVNPHDVYVAQHGPCLGYTQEDFERIQVPLPSNWNEAPDHNNKPRAQGQMSIPFVTFKCQPQDYVNFYAYLHTIVDAQIGKVLDAFDQFGLTDNTLILRTADHGEQSLSHSLVEKFYNAYEESIHIPLIVSNPLLFPNPVRTKALASHVDILPTFYNLLGLEEGDDPSLNADFVGQDLTPVLNQSTGSVQSSVHFTYDDIPCPNCPSIVRCIRTSQFKYAVYFTPNGKDADWELYDLEDDPLENNNLAGQPNYAKVQADLEDQLVESMKRLKTLPQQFAWPPKASKYSVGGEGWVVVERPEEVEEVA
jgi:choline-sulfatase